MSLQENGYPVAGPVAFVAADLIAKLSGVNLSTVRTVIAAIDSIEQVYGIDSTALTDASMLPSALPDTQRSELTSAAYTYFCGHSKRVPDYIKAMLRLPATA